MLTTIIASLAFVTAPVEPAVSVTKFKTFSNIKATAIATSPQGTLFAVASEDRQVRIIDSKTMETKFQLTGHPFTVYGLAFSPDGKYLLSGDESARIWLWNTANGQKVREFPRDKSHTRGIQSFAFARNGKSFASVGKDDIIKVWSTAGGHPTHTILGSGANFYGVAFLPSGALATGTLKEGLRVYSPTFSLAATMKLGGGQGANDIAVSPTGNLGLTAGRDGNVTVWDISKREKLASMLGHSDWVLGVAVAPNGRLAASSSTDTKVVVWDIKAYKKVATITDRAFVDSLVAFTNDGKYLLTTDAGNALQVFKVDPPAKS
jgi:WD40 repeat protein